MCGKEYEACHTQRPNLNNEFRWQEVACSPECGQIYLQRIIASRSGEIVESGDKRVEDRLVKKTSSRKKSKTKLADDNSVLEENAIE